MDLERKRGHFLHRIRTPARPESFTSGPAGLRECELPSSVKVCCGVAHRSATIADRTLHRNSDLDIERPCQAILLVLDASLSSIGICKDVLSRCATGVLTFFNFLVRASLVIATF